VQVQFAWVRLTRSDGGGDSKRVKFVLLCWTGEAAGVLAKGRLPEHRAVLSERLRPTHVSLSLTERAALATLDTDVDAALRAAGGADYDAGNAAAGVTAGATATIKRESAAFFKQKDSETKLTNFQFEKHTRTDGKRHAITPCDLGNRVMTVRHRRAGWGWWGPDAVCFRKLTSRRPVHQPGERHRGKAQYGGLHRPQGDAQNRHRRRPSTSTCEGSAADKAGHSQGGCCHTASGGVATCTQPHCAVAAQGGRGIHRGRGL
jgi:hypothetical protein